MRTHAHSLSLCIYLTQQSEEIDWDRHIYIRRERKKCTQFVYMCQGMRRKRHKNHNKLNERKKYNFIQSAHTQDNRWNTKQNQRTYYNNKMQWNEIIDALPNVKQTSLSLLHIMLHGLISSPHIHRIESNIHTKNNIRKYFTSFRRTNCLVLHLQSGKIMSYCCYSVSVYRVLIVLLTYDQRISVCILVSS